MARTGALFNGPVEVTDPANGKQIALLLTDVFFDGNQIKAQGNVYNANKNILDAFLGHLAKTGAITPAPVAAAKPVMVITAKTAGSTGNFIQVEFKNFDNSIPATPKFDATVTETDTYTGLTPDTVQKVLGSTATNGTKTGLVFVPGSAPAANALPKADTYWLKVVNPATAATADIILNAAGGGTAFKLQAKADGKDGELTKATIKDVDIGASTFTLIVDWKKDAPTKIDAAAVGTTFSYEIDVSAPSGATLAAPAAGVVTLSGGADAAAASQASATVSG